ncbi:MAG TPA: hypothetical protein GXZ47_10575 [Treponema sp.]|nr:hypothetical protein [Treponema sp.]
MRVKFIIFLILPVFIGSLFAASCSSVKSRPIHDMDGIMYGMIYDFDNIAVTNVQVFVNEKKIGESDIQGRFILSSNKGGDYGITLKKAGYEDVHQTFSFDPMNVLYFKMINTAQLLTLAETALDINSFNEAFSFLDRAAVIGNNRCDILFLQTIVLYQKGEYESAATKLLEIEAQGYTDESVNALKNRINKEIEK